MLANDGATEKNFRGLVSRIDDPYLEETMTEMTNQLRRSGDMS